MIFCPLKTMAFMIIKGNNFCGYFPLYSKGNNSIFLRQSTYFPLRFEGISYNSVYVITFGWVCCCFAFYPPNGDDKMFKKCSTDQRFILKRNTTYKI